MQVCHSNIDSMNIKSQVWNDLKLGCADFICNIYIYIYSLRS